MSKFIINNIESLNLILDRVKSGDPASYEFLNRYFQAFLDNDNFLMKQIKEEISQLKEELTSGEIVIPGTGGGSGETGIGALGVPTFLCDNEPEVDKSVDYIWFKPIRKSSVIVPDPEDPDVPPTEDPVVTFILEATEADDGWHIQIEDILKAIENATSNPDEAEEGDYVITPVED